MIREALTTVNNLNLIEPATPNSERDPKSHEYRRLVWVYPTAAELLNEIMDNAEQNLQDPDDYNKLEKIKQIRELFFSLHNALNTSNPRE
jgi:hypothetical protein